MKKIVLACGILGILGALSIGCGGNACEKAADQVEAKFTDCGATLPTTSGTSGSTECTDDLGKKSQCSADCISAASCDCIGAGDITKCTADQAKSYGDCSTACQ